MEQTNKLQQLLLQLLQPKLQRSNAFKGNLTFGAELMMRNRLKKRFRNGGIGTREVPGLHFQGPDHPQPVTFSP